MPMLRDVSRKAPQVAPPKRSNTDFEILRHLSRNHETLN